MVTVLNRGALRQPWEITFTVPNGLTLYSGWNADVRLSGTNVTATAPAWNRSLRTGDEASVGFVVAGPSSPPPSDVRLNGVACQ
jgi:cellulase/cellobiase CelA1